MRYVTVFYIQKNEEMRGFCVIRVAIRSFLYVALQRIEHVS
jgi:hypothetical protein